MKNEVPHPFAVEIGALAKPEGHFGWAIRKRGKLMERSDRTYPTIEKAHAGALNALERSLKPGAF